MNNCNWCGWCLCDSQYDDEPMKLHVKHSIITYFRQRSITIMAEEKKGTSWMYNPVSEINREDYLLGKKVGKDFDAEGTMGKINDVEYDCTPASIFASQAGHQVGSRFL